jgi:plastocyanin
MSEKRTQLALRGLAIASALAFVACGTPAASSSPSAAATPEPASEAPASPSEAPASEAPSAAPSEAALQQLEITGTDFAFELPATIPAGLTSITLANEGQEEHQAQVAGLNEGSTFEDLTAALQGNNEVEALGMLSLSGGPTGVVPGDSGTTASNLAPGQYAVLCFVRSPDGVPHFAKGMVAPFEVTGTASTEELPAGDAELTLQDFAFVGLNELDAGEHTISVTNTGPQPHEATLVELADGIEIGDLIPMFTSTEPPTGPPPFTSVGGLTAIMPNTSATIDVDVEPGNYAWLCFVPDPGSGQPHAALGMIAALTVQ